METYDLSWSETGLLDVDPDVGPNRQHMMVLTMMMVLIFDRESV
jgi:hypothetical protein